MWPGPSRQLLIGGDGSAQKRRGRPIGVRGASEPGEGTGSMDPDQDKGKEGGRVCAPFRSSDLYYDGVEDSFGS